MSLFRPRRVEGVETRKRKVDWQYKYEIREKVIRCLEADLARAKRFEKDRQALAEELARRNAKLRQEIVKLKADLIEAQQASSDRRG